MSVRAELPMPSNVRKIDSLQILRAVAVILVAWVHVGQIMVLMTGRSLPSLGVYGIDVFFIISGFIMATIVFHSRKMRPLLFLRRRLIRIFPVYWIFAVLGAAEMLYSHARITVDYLPSLFLLPSFTSYGDPARFVAAAWTLVFEMGFYVTVAFALCFSVKWAVEISAGILCTLVVAGLIFGTRHPFAIVFMSPMLLEFVFGCLIAFLYRRSGKRVRLGVALCVLGILSAVALMWSPYSTANGMQMVMAGSHVWMRVATWGVSAACLVAGGVLWSPSCEGPITTLFIVLGDASYSTYLLASFVIEATSRWAFRVVGPTALRASGMQVFMQVAIVALVLLSGFAFYRIVEWPLLRKLSSR